MNLKLVISSLVVYVFAISFAFAQDNLSQVVKGIVRDADSHSVLPGATIVIETVNPVMGTTTDNNGNFKLSKVPVGRHNLRISLLGYENYIVRELLVNSSKEVVLTIDLKESTIALNEVVIKANSNKEQPINSMASISVRQLSVEEANRFAGGFDDPARLASAYAGVAGNLSNNGIVIRGNSPKGMLWRMEGVDISTPSHFANITTFGGGGITALSSQMLTNSDFYTGAFPAEYGNAISGVFDLKLRSGNNEKNEFTIQVGAIGLDFAAEGPIIKGKRASFLLNYRYSTFGLLSPLLPADAGGILYQDLCFILNFPTANAGTFSMWGIGAIDKNPQFAESDSSKWIYTQDMEEGKNNLGMGGVGLNHNLLLGTQTYLHSSIAASGNYLDHFQERYNTSVELMPLNKVLYDNWKYAFSSYLNHKFSSRHTHRIGFSINRLQYHIDIRETDTLGLPLKQLIYGIEGGNLFQYFSQSKLQISDKMVLNIGLHGQYFGLNKEHILEPRASISYSINSNHTITFGYGLHSQSEMLQVYLIKTGNDYPNKNLKFTKAHHWIGSYQWKVNSNFHIKVEPYFQLLRDVPVKERSSFSVLNLEKDWFLTDTLVNKGEGRNWGIDFTLEHFLFKGYYYLFTTSFLSSQYKGGDGIIRNTRYNRSYVVNILGGKEWNLKNNKMLSINGRLNFLGGEHISPLNNGASLVQKEAVYQENRAFSESKPNVWYADFTINYKINRKRHSTTWSLKMINVLGTKEFYGYRYNHKNGLMEREEEAIMLPNLSYKIEF